MAKRGRPRGFERETALRAAMELFSRRGYEGVSLAELTAAMGINPPSLYAAFGSKEALFREAVALHRATVFAPVAAALEDGSTARTAIGGMLAAAARAFAAASPAEAAASPPGSLAILGAVNCAPENAGLADFLADGRRGFAGLIAARIERARDAGEVAADADAAAIAGVYAAVLHGMAIAAFDGADAAALDAVAARALAGFEAVAGPAPARPKPAAAKAGGKAEKPGRDEPAPQLRLF